MEEDIVKLHSFLGDLKLDIIEIFPSVAIKIIWIMFLIFSIKPTIKIVIKGLELLFEKNNVDPLLRSFTLSFVTITLYVGFFFLVIGGLGIQGTSFVTILGTAGIAIGLALQGSLSNLAGGVLILFFKPFSKGDYITTTSGSGTVESIYILYTVLLTLDNSRISVPNGNLANSPVTNLSTSNHRMFDLIFSASYDNDIDLVKKTLESVAKSHPNIIHDRGYTIRLKTHNTSSLDFVFRAWVKNVDYWSTYYDLMENVKKSFDENGIEIPYNKLDIYQK